MDHRISRTLRRAAALGMLSLLASTGCQTVREGAEPGIRVQDSRAPNAGIHMNSVAILDESLQSPTQGGKISVEQVKTRRTGTGTLEVMALLRNRTDFPLQIEARTHFFDGTEYPVEPPSGWTRIHLPGKSVNYYKAYSTHVEDVANFYVEVREAL